MTELTRLERSFYARHLKEPRIYEAFDKYTRELIAAGVTRYSADAVMHRIRFQDAVEKRPSFRISNNHIAYYARLWMVKNPEHIGFFKTRNVLSLPGEDITMKTFVGGRALNTKFDVKPDGTLPPGTQV